MRARICRKFWSYSSNSTNNLTKDGVIMAWRFKILQKVYRNGKFDHFCNLAWNIDDKRLANSLVTSFAWQRHCKEKDLKVLRYSNNKEF